MKEIKTVDAVGHVICHDISQIIPGGKRGVPFKKGHIVREEDIAVLHSLGKMHLFVWEPDENLVHENEAAAILYGLIGGINTKGNEPSEGKITVTAAVDGVLRIDKDRLFALNMTDDAAVAARHDFAPVRKGDSLAATRIIPLFIEKEKLQTIREIGVGAPILNVLPYKHMKVGIVTTGNEVYEGLIQDGFAPILRKKLAEFDVEDLGQIIVPDDNESATKAILKFKEEGADLILVTGGMSVDPDDRTPLAIRNTGAEVITYGTPVFPGAMFLVSYLEGSVVLGLPGGLLHSKRSMFDILLPRILAGIRIENEDIKALGLGGLCLNCETCVFPICGFGAV
ncbi:MAG: molybdopterin-binding protein [Clostridiales Family XIII bacterium]|jgi:molybdenum cofactor synthesis domain-containing protein|nr:molybdopterin-binding protein [Clostridiales Family XIII bacterium]